MPFFFGLNTRNIMPRILIKTLIDVTCSKAKRPGQGDATEINQYRNYTTLLQAVGLRTNINFDSPPEVNKEKLNSDKFGSAYGGKSHQLWTFEFETDRSDVYYEQEDPLFLLKEDLHNVPVVKNLQESINIVNAVFDLKSDKYKNTSVSIV